MYYLFGLMILCGIETILGYLLDFKIGSVIFLILYFAFTMIWAFYKESNDLEMFYENITIG